MRAHTIIIGLVQLVFFFVLFKYKLVLLYLLPNSFRCLIFTLASLAIVCRSFAFFPDSSFRKSHMVSDLHSSINAPHMTTKVVVTVYCFQCLTQCQMPQRGEIYY
eukprot:TRINITY_DN19667_c3_g1_i1.p1 TRINITY_DN19667_c3_g1~~TRINITY_DN19667_c3_g1_i1.p1  ORF type:complete len:105 (+),score=3.71 TRINITY_DN19667_c3_g1_i1:372-686(+)